MWNSVTLATLPTRQEVRKHALYNTEYVNNNNMNQDIGGNMEGEYNEELDFTNIIGNNDENGENEMD